MTLLCRVNVLRRLVEISEINSCRQVWRKAQLKGDIDVGDTEKPALEFLAEGGQSGVEIQSSVVISDHRARELLGVLKLAEGNSDVPEGLVGHDVLTIEP